MPANVPRILRNHVDNGPGGEEWDGDENEDGGDGKDVDYKSWGAEGHF